jgi:hypothetical protein
VREAHALRDPGWGFIDHGIPKTHALSKIRAEICGVKSH